MSAHLAAEGLAAALLLLGLTAVAWGMDRPPRLGSLRRARRRTRAARERAPRTGCAWLRGGQFADRRREDTGVYMPHSLGAAHALDGMAVAGRWEREARQVLRLAGMLDVALDQEALILGDMRDLAALRAWLVARQDGKGLSSRHPISGRVRPFLAGPT